ncbi:MAG TPA: hypothetical protein VMF66_18540 [Candidatus Acidoferrum sp.]|nr:hypothetical protein [Candidatus Acidoferrum sp.]
MKCALVMSLLGLLAMPVFAQDQAMAARTAAGCGADNTQYAVKTDKAQHPQGQIPGGKALVYVFEQEKVGPGFKIGAVTVRVGLDGQWIGANHGNTYFFFAVAPGDHSICANWQSSIGRLAKLASAASLTAAPGQTYYFQARVDERSHDNPAVWMEPVDPAEAKILIASASLSNFCAKN